MTEPAAVLRPDATVPMAPGARPPPAQPSPELAAGRKNERMERRELLYTVVREAMVRAGVLSASYKFKVLSLDQRGRQFLVMMDLAREYGGETARLSEIEALIAQTAKARYDILVTAVYWRINDHVAVGIPLKGVAPQGAALPQAAAPQPAATRRATGLPAGVAAATAVPAAAVATTAPAPLAPAAVTAPAPLAAAPAPAKAPAQRFEPIEADEVAAFKRALANAAGPRPAAGAAQPPRPAPARSSSPLLQPSVPTGFEDTEMSSSDSPAPDLSSTQYGELR